MECQRYQAQFSAYLDGELSPEEQRQMQSHLQECLPCYRQWNRLQKTVKILRRLPQLDPPPHLVAAALARVGADRLSRFSWLVGGWRRPIPLGAGIAVVVLLGLSLTIWRLWPPPPGPTSGPAGRITSATPALQASTASVAPKQRSVGSESMLVLRVKDFTQANQQLAALLQSLARSAFEDQQVQPSISSSRGRLIDIQLPGEHYNHFMEELGKIGRLDPGPRPALNSSLPPKEIAVRILLLGEKPAAR